MKTKKLSSHMYKMDVRSFYGKKPARGRRPARLGRTRVAKVSKPIRTAIKRAVNASEETKMVSQTIWNTDFNGTITSGDPQPVMPLVQAGTTEYNRIGDKIKSVGLYVKGSIATNNLVVGGIPVSQDNRPIAVRVMVLSQRNLKTPDQVASSFAYKTLLKPNNEEAGVIECAFDGTAVVANYPINKELFTVHYDKTITLLPVRMPPDSTSFSVEARPQAYRRISFKVACPKVLHFDDNVGTATGMCINACPFLVLGYSYPDGSPADTVTQRVYGKLDSYLYFKE